MDLKQKYEFFKNIKEEELINQYSKVLIVDGMNLYIRCFAAISTMNDDGAHIGGVSGFLQSLAATIRTYKYSRVIIAFDGKGGSQRRRALFEDYKGNRRNMTKLNRTYDFHSLEDEDNSRKWQLSLLVQMLKCLPVTILFPDNVEADDVIAYLSNIIVERGGKVVIMSTDKDFLQLVNDDISMWNPAKKKMYRPELVVEDYGFHPHNFPIYRAITGDKSDNIEGVSGIKEKTLHKLIPFLSEENKWDLEMLFSYMKDYRERLILEKTKVPKSLESLLDNREIVERNLKLMKLDDVMMSGNTRLKVLEILDAPLPKVNKFVLTNLAATNKFIGAFGNFDSWLQTSFIPLTRFITND